MTGILIRDRKGKDTQRHRGRRPCKDGGRDWNFVATSQEMAGHNRSWRDRKQSPLEPSEKICPPPTDTLTSKCEKNKLFLF